ncbi:DUF3558 family protein [Saccharopolyspora sp. 5N708]|uniref:DUF3558 family protein n=1 Tax=Saccharopolyspora sp. 5N708 TaxID=3457424 RepID=UPI003FD100C7
MGKGLAAGAIAAGLLLAGCSSGAAPDDPPPTGSARTATAKSIAVADPCTLLSADQATSLGLDQQPKPGAADGKAGCQYEAGTPGGPGWSAFVAADPQRTFPQFIGAELGADRLDLGGYPTAKVNGASGCTFVVDVADTGSLLVTALVRSGAPIEVGGSCDAAQRVTEAALQNLPAA